MFQVGPRQVDVVDGRHRVLGGPLGRLDERFDRRGEAEFGWDGVYRIERERVEERLSREGVGSLVEGPRALRGSVRAGGAGAAIAVIANEFRAVETSTRTPWPEATSGTHRIDTRAEAW